MRGILESAIRLWPMLAAAGFAAAQGAGLAAGLGASVPEAVVLRLDDPRFAVTERDIADYQVSQRCYPGGLDSRKAAFMRQLEPAVLSRLLFASSGIDISARAMAEEEARVDRETKAPDILACIKSHFGADRERYRRVFLRPILVQKEFYRHLGFDRKVQAKAYADAEAVAKAMADKTFGSLAVRLGLEYSSTTYRAEEASGAAAKGPPSSEGGRAPLPEGAADGKAAFEAHFIEAYLKGLPAGKARPEPVDSDSELLFIKLLEKDGPRYRFETLRIRKMTLNRFLDAQPRIPAEVSDAELKAWLKGIAGNPYLGLLDIP